MILCAILETLARVIYVIYSKGNTLRRVVLLEIDVILDVIDVILYPLLISTRDFVVKTISLTKQDKFIKDVFNWLEIMKINSSHNGKRYCPVHCCVTREARITLEATMLSKFT